MPHPFLLALDIVPRSLFTHGDRLARLTASRHGLWDNRCWIALRTSALARPFWGLRRRVVQQFTEAGCWAVMLLDGPETGWVVPGNVAEGLILTRRWHLARDDEYKITPPLPAACRFTTMQEALARLHRC